MASCGVDGAVSLQMVACRLQDEAGLRAWDGRRWKRRGGLEAYWTFDGGLLDSCKSEDDFRRMGPLAFRNIGSQWQTPPNLATME